MVATYADAADDAVVATYATAACEADVANDADHAQYADDADAALGVVNATSVKEEEVAYEEDIEYCEVTEKSDVCEDAASTAHDAVIGYVDPVVNVDPPVPPFNAYDAVKAVDSKIKVIVHIDEGNNKEKSKWFYENIATQNVKYDVIGLSYYPFWVKKDYTETISDLQENMNYLAQKYNKEVMIVEVGGEADKVENTQQLLDATLKAVRNIPNKKGIGVMYWEPQGIESWSHYSLNAWLENGQPSPALQAFKK